LQWDVAPFMNCNGGIAGAILLMEDITEVASLNRQLREWERLATAGEVAAGLAHEIRNPLAAAMGTLQLLDIASNEKQQKDLLAKFSGELDRINRVLTEFLNLTKFDDIEELGPVNLSDVVNEIWFLVRGEALLNNINVIISPNGYGDIWAMANSNSLKQVFINIAKNALQAMGEGGSLKVSLGRDDTHAWVEFADSGSGIPLQHLDNIFQPFFTTKVGGTGLGLAISNRIISQMEGEIKIESVPGCGTNVTVSIPAWYDI